MSDWLDSFREDTERIRLETEEIKKETEVFSRIHNYRRYSDSNYT